MATWSSPKNDYTAEDQVRPEIFNNLAENERYLYESKITIEQVQDATVSSSQSSTRTNLLDTETVKTAFGKIRKWLADLGSLAFKSIVDSGDIASAAITQGKILSHAVTYGKIATGAVRTDKIEDLAVTTAKLADAVVTAAKIAAGAVTNDKIASVAAAKVTGLATVATSGDYNDLKNKPTLPSGVTVVDNLTSTSSTSALSARQGKVLNDRLTELGFDSGACSLTQSGVLNVTNSNTFTELAPDGTSKTLNACNYWLKCGKYVMVHLDLTGATGTSGTTQIAANATFATVPSKIRPRTTVKTDGFWGQTTEWVSSASSKTSTVILGKHTFTVNTSGNISCDTAQTYSISSSGSKTGGSGHTTIGLCYVNIFWRIS